MPNMLFQRIAKNRIGKLSAEKLKELETGIKLVLSL
jgi:hypothetical protein